MFHFADLAPYYKVSGYPEELPHSEIIGSKTACASPMRFAACCVLPRCQMPWHPPYALTLFVLSIHQCLIFNCQYTQGNYLLN